MRYIAMFALLSWFSLSLMAEESNVDSLRKAYDGSTDLEKKITLALTLGDYYFYTKQDSAEYFYSEMCIRDRYLVFSKLYSVSSSSAAKILPGRTFALAFFTFHLVAEL